MARIRIQTEEKLEWVMAKDRPRGSIEQSELREGELTVGVRIREPGTASSSQLLELRYEPNAEIQLHAHDEDEIIFVREGEILLGNNVYGPGTSIFVAGHTLYGFSAGPNGLQILNFRPRQDFTFVTKKEFLARNIQI